MCLLIFNIILHSQVKGNFMLVYQLGEEMRTIIDLEGWLKRSFMFSFTFSTVWAKVQKWFPKKPTRPNRHKLSLLFAAGWVFLLSLTHPRITHPWSIQRNLAEWGICVAPGKTNCKKQWSKDNEMLILQRNKRDKAMQVQINKDYFNMVGGSRVLCLLNKRHSPAISTGLLRPKKYVSLYYDTRYWKSLEGCPHHVCKSSPNATSKHLKWMIGTIQTKFG